MCWRVLRCFVQAVHLRDPWQWLLPALCAAGQPLLDPRFNFLITPAAQAGASSTAAAAAGDGPPSAPPLPVHMLLGLQPMIGRPPFIGPLVKKLAATQHVLGGLDWGCGHSKAVQQLSTGLTAAVSAWDEPRWTQLFTLLTDHPPRDLQPDGVRFLRSLPMYRLVAQPQHQQEREQQQDPEGAGQQADAGAAAATRPQLVALESSTDWVLAPAAALQACAGALCEPEVPHGRFATSSRQQTLLQSARFERCSCV